MRAALAIPSNIRIPIRVASASNRIKHEQITQHVLSAAVPTGSFWELRIPTSRTQAVGHNLYIDGPELCILNVANELMGRVRAKQYQRSVAVAKLADLIMELCGTYARDPRHPQTGSCTFNVSPATSIGAIEQLLDCIAAGRGAKLIRQALRLASEGSRSPMESFLYLAFAAPPRFGGINAHDVLLNQPLDLSEQDLRLINHRVLTPDFQLRSFDALVEYLGQGPHEGQEAKEEDRRRWQDYTALRKRSYPLQFSDVRSPMAFNAFCKRMIHGMDNGGRRVQLHRLGRIFKDTRFQEAQASLFKWLLPPITKYGAWFADNIPFEEEIWGV